jgi:2'-5' RNA ligase
MSELVRVFFALPLRDADKPTLLDVLGKLRQAAEGSRLRPRFVVPEQLHVTLKFLGSVEPDKIEILRAVGARCAAEHARFDLCFQQVIAFGGPRRARTIVAALAHQGSSLALLAQAIDDAVAPLGIARETREFRPHVTLARIKRPGDARKLLEQARLEPSPASFPELRLYQSVQTPSGAVYTALDTWSFG